MRTFEESLKSKKTIASMIVNKEKENTIPAVEKKRIEDETPTTQPIFDNNISMFFWKLLSFVFLNLS